MLETLFALLLLKDALDSANDAAEAQKWHAPPDETYYLFFQDGSFRRVHIPERNPEFDEFDDFVKAYNSGSFGGGPIIRIVSVSLQRQRLATGRDGTVWPNTVPTFYVHFSDGVVSQLNLEPSEVEFWAQQWRSFKILGVEVSITEICDDKGYVIWPERDGSRIL